MRPFSVIVGWGEHQNHLDAASVAVKNGVLAIWFDDPTIVPGQEPDAMYGPGFWQSVHRRD